MIVTSSKLSRFTKKNLNKRESLPTLNTWISCNNLPNLYTKKNKLLLQSLQGHKRKRNQQKGGNIFYKKSKKGAKMDVDAKSKSPKVITTSIINHTRRHLG